MSWPRTYSGGGQIPPQGGQSNLPNQLVQMMQMQLQMQHNIQLQKQQQFNPPKNRDNQDNGKAVNSGIGNTANKPIDQGSNKGDKKETAESGAENKNSTVNKISPEQKKSDSSDIAKQQPNKSHSNNSNTNVNGANNQSLNKGKPSESKIKIEPPSPQTPRQSSAAKGSLLGSAPVPAALLPNPPPPPSQESTEKTAFPNESYNQNQDYSSNNQGNRSNRSNYNNERQNQSNDYYQGASGHQGGTGGHQGGTGGHQGGTGGHQGGTGGHQGGTGGHQGGSGTVSGHQGGGGGGRWQNQQNSSRSISSQKDWQNQQNAPRSDAQKDWQTQQNTSRQASQKDWPNQPNAGRAPSQKDWQSQPDVKNFNTYSEGGNDYSKNSGSSSNYQSNTTDYSPHSRHGRNMNPGGVDRSARQPPPYVKREARGGYYNPAGRLKDTLKMAFPGPVTDLEPLDTSEKKFNAYSKVFVGNIPRNVEEEELLSLFNAYGEIGTTYVNKDSSFGFLTFDYKANAAKAVREVDNKSLKNRYLKVRFAMINEGIRVKNLSPYVSNELLEKAFAAFGPIESCRVLVDDRGNPKFEGIIIYKEKRSAALALKTCQEECFYLSGLVSMDATGILSFRVSFL